jgi:glyoxylase-like metal-dependent hydrolase (beta-lactamase superfamily II)
MTFVDLHFLGQRHVIGTAVLRGPSGTALIDPGPASCLPALERGLRDSGTRLEDVRALLLTHIHLDHAGATGTLLARFPELEVYVHERGAPHMIDPAKLLASATRLYGNDMERLWGEFRSVPADRVRVLKGGEELHVAGRSLQVAYTPGHASHHVAFLDLSDGVAYVGDVGGIRVSEGCVIAPTPPPDIDLEAWEGSIQRVEAWRPAAMVLTHFGRVERVGDHFDHLRTVLDRAATRVRQTLTLDGDDEARIRHFVDEMRADVRRVLSEEDADATETAAPFAQLWQGLARYWRKRLAL